MRTGNAGTGSSAGAGAWHIEKMLRWCLVALLHRGAGWVSVQRCYAASPFPALTPFDASAQHLLPPQGNIYVLITLSLNKPKSSEMNMLMFVRPWGRTSLGSTMRTYFCQRDMSAKPYRIFSYFDYQILALISLSTILCYTENIFNLFIPAFIYSRFFVIHLNGELMPFDECVFTLASES